MSRGVAAVAAGNEKGEGAGGAGVVPPPTALKYGYPRAKVT